MALNIPLPNFTVQPPDILGAQKNALELSALRGNLALQPLQLQQARQNLALQPVIAQQEAEKLRQTQIANQMQEITLQGQKAMTDYFQNPDKYQDVPASDVPQNSHLASFLGIEASDPLMSLGRGLFKAGVPMPMVMAELQGALQRREAYNKGTQEQQGVIKNAYDAFSSTLAEIAAEKDPVKQAVELQNALPTLGLAAKPVPELTQLAQHLADHPEDVNSAVSMVSAHQKIYGIQKSKAEATTAEQKVINPETGMSPENEAEARKQITVETNPQVQAGKVAVAKAEATARESVQLAMEPLRLQIQQTFANQKDARDKIETSVLKPFQDKMTDITMARSALQQAQDNPVAARAAVFKMIGVSQPTGSHRVLPAEIIAFQYPGGVGDKIVEKWNNFLKGEPWTPEVAQAASAFIDGQEQAAHTGLNSGIDNVNKLYSTQVGTGLKQSNSQTAQPVVRKYQGHDYVQQSDGSWKRK